MRTDTKISKLRAAILAGERLTPLDAWRRWNMAHNTFNRQLWELRHVYKMPIASKIINYNGVRYNAHYLEQ